jgi:hypothetical protein
MVRLNCLSILGFVWIFCCSGCTSTKSQSQHIVQGTICENYCFAGAVLLMAEDSRSSYLRHNYHPLWNPSTNDANYALGQVKNYLLQADNFLSSRPGTAKELPGVLERLPKTVCQAVGVTYAKRKGILLNCLPSDVDEDWHEDWKKEFVKVFDGGPKYWSVIYLPDERRFVRLGIDLGF